MKCLQRKTESWTTCSGAHASEAPRQAFKARWIFPGDGPPIENATIELADGRIGDVHTRHNPRAIDLGNTAVIPGLVNAHTHLEFSGLEAPLEPAASFAEWLQSVVAHRRTRPSAIEPVVRGAAESGAAGTTLLADIVTDDAVPPAYPPGGPAVVAFRELIGLLPGQAGERLETARQFLEAGEVPAAAATGGPPVATGCAVVRGLSPHSPYSVGPDLYHGLVELARGRRAPLAVHLAETRAELELLREGTGELVEMLAGFGVWSDAAIPRGSRPLDYLRPLAALERALVVHGNYLDAAEIDFVAGHPQLTVVYCPRTHAYFGHREHPWRELLARGASIALGTDSRASNPDLSVFDELRFLHDRHPEVDPQVLLRLGTLAGAQALGFADVSGRLAPGKSADLAVVALLDFGPADAFGLLFHPRSRVVRVMQGGCWRPS
ncbi:MAG TPA: amidohydrolase family protein [Planctomycetaceae bacterium]|nr:amidohydrolase family protein [Planctomycetaceae bacterium]